MSSVRVLLAVVTVLSLLSACPKTEEKPPPPPELDPLVHPASPKWEEQIIYFVMTDRFANGDPSNDDQDAGEYDPSTNAKYSGGDLQGVIDQLDYIQGLGATAVWVTPPVANLWWDPLQQFGGSHGYWARDLSKVDEHLGTLATYQTLARELHKRGMYLIQDIVPNHMGNYFTWQPEYPAACLPTTTQNTCAVGPAISGCDVTMNFVRNTGAVPTSAPTQAPFDQVDATNAAQRDAAIYHWTPAIADYTSACQEWNFEISDLDDLNTENPVVRQALRESYAYWIREVGVDAFRVDTAKFVPHDFWNDFFWSTDTNAPGIMNVAKAYNRDHFLAFGEVLESPAPLSEGDALESKVVAYLGTTAKPELNSVLGFPLYTEFDRVLAGGQPTAYLGYRLERLMDPSVYPNPHVIPNFLDNHDVRRFLSITSGTGEDLLLGLSVLFTVPGIPVVYYGTEQGFTEPRAAMFEKGWKSGGADHYGTTSAIYQRIKKLSDLRKQSPAMMRGAVQVLTDNAAGAGPLGYLRVDGTEKILVLVNTSKKKALFANLDTTLAAGTVLEVLHTERSAPTPLVGPDGRVTVVLPSKAVLIARGSSEVVAPPPPAAALAVTTPIAGQTFTTDTTFSGTVSPATTAVKMVLDGNSEEATDVTVAGDGTWSVLAKISEFPTGRYPHDVAFWAPDAGVATSPQRFTSDVVFAGQTYDYADAVGDDTGPDGGYAYPLDATFHHEMDITAVKLEVGATTMRLNLTMKDFSTVWNPANGFDHVYFNVFFSLPGQSGETVMPKLNGSVPAGFSWSYQQFTGGFNNELHTSAGATADKYGAPAIAPQSKGDANTKTVTFTYDRRDFGLSDWSGVGLYVTTWDFDGIGARFRPLCTTASQWEMGGGGASDAGTPCDGPGLLSDDPKVMDDFGPIAIP